jgi:hypothetical protein
MLLFYCQVLLTQRHGLGEKSVRELGLFFAGMSSVVADPPGSLRVSASGNNQIAEQRPKPRF